MTGLFFYQSIYLLLTFVCYCVIGLLYFVYHWAILGLSYYWTVIEIHAYTLLCVGPGSVQTKWNELCTAFDV